MLCREAIIIVFQNNVSAPWNFVNTVSQSTELHTAKPRCSYVSKVGLHIDSPNSYLIVVGRRIWTLTYLCKVEAEIWASVASESPLCGWLHTATFLFYFLFSLFSFQCEYLHGWGFTDGVSCFRVKGELGHKNKFPLCTTEATIISRCFHVLSNSNRLPALTWTEIISGF